MAGIDRRAAWLPDGMDPETSYNLEFQIFETNPPTPLWDEEVEVPCTPSMANPCQMEGSQTTYNTSQACTDTQPKDNCLLNPEPENEYVGVDEEGLYIEVAKQPTVISDTDHAEDFDEEAEPDSESESFDSDNEEDEGDEMVKDYVPPNNPEIVYDRDDPPMTVGSIYPNMSSFKLALASHAIRDEFEYDIEKSEPGRYRVYCSGRMEGCRWRIHASTMGDELTVKVKKNPYPHDCQSTRRSGKVKGASKFWVAENVKDWLVENPKVKAKELQRRLQDKFKVVVHYKRVWYGKELALAQLFGSWSESFDNLYRFKKQIESSCPGSMVVIDHHTVNEKIRFNRLFFAMKPCIDGFLQGCRPYLAIDSTFLTGRFRGQLCVACAVDGHNWMYPVAVGVIDSETNENWQWFMERLKEAIGTPPGLTFCTDCGQAVMFGVSTVFPFAEHRECMYHLVQNFKKRYSGKVFDDHLWASSYSWNSYMFEKHWAAMAAAKPEAMVYLQQSHTKLWTRSQFSTLSKIDYVTNNLAESFNNWIKNDKGQHLPELMDTIRQKILIKWNQRRKIARNMKGKILEHIINKLKMESRNLDIEVITSSDGVAEVCAKGGTGFRFVVNLDERTCSCRAWQVSGIPCKHALAFITSISREKIEDHVDEYYSVKKFMKAYEGKVPSLPDKSMWPKSNHGFFMHPPLLKSTAGRRKETRFKAATEGGNGNKSRHECPICHDYGHHWYTCKKGNPEDIEAMLADRGPPKKKKKKTAPASTETSIVPVPQRMIFPALPSTTTASKNVKKRKRSSTTSSNGKKKKTSSTSTSSGPSVASVRRSGTGSNNLELLPLSISYPTMPEEVNREKAVADKKKGGQKNKNETPEAVDSPAMSTRSKTTASPSSPAMGTRSKRKLKVD